MNDQNEWMRTWTAIAEALSWNRISEQWIDIIKRISKSRISQSCIIIKSNQLVNQSISHICGAPTKARLFFEWINFINSIIKNYENKFTIILKHLKIKENLKVACRKENGGQILLKMRFLMILRKKLKMKIKDK